MRFSGGAVGRLIPALVLLGALVPTPAHAARFECGGFAPVATSCETQFVLPEPIRFFVVGGEGWPLEGRVELNVEGPTGSHSFSCLIATIPGTSVPHCLQSAHEGHFLAGQTLTLRGNMLGVGTWHVYILT